MVRTSIVSTITFRTDVDNTAVSSAGIVHGIRYIDDGTIAPREQNVFCWVRDAQHVEKVGEFMRKRKFDEKSLVFIPYSSRDNWVRRYPVAVPTLECTREGVIVDREKIGINNPEMVLPASIKNVAGVIPTINVPVEKRTRREFDDYMQKLIEFKEEHGHVDVPKSYDKDPKLGKWVGTIRLKMKALQSQGLTSETPKPNSGSMSSGSIGGTTALTEERIEQLDALGFSWECEEVRARLSWEHRFQELCEYYQVHGHWPPRTAGTIGEWAHKQKTKEVKRDKVFMEKYYAKLDSVGFPWRQQRSNHEM